MFKKQCVDQSSNFNKMWKQEHFRMMKIKKEKG